MTKKKLAVAWFFIFGLSVLGILAFVFSAIRFSSYIIFGIVLIIPSFLALRRLSVKKPQLARILKGILIGVLCVVVLFSGITELFIIRASKGF